MPLLFDSIRKFSIRDLFDIRFDIHELFANSKDNITIMLKRIQSLFFLAFLNFLGQLIFVNMLLNLTPLENSISSVKFGIKWGC